MTSCLVILEFGDLFRDMCQYVSIETLLTEVFTDRHSHSHPIWCNKPMHNHTTWPKARLPSYE